MEVNKTIAFCILAHNDSHQLVRLIQRLCCDFDLYVHIDATSNICIKDLPQYENVFYYQEYNVYWGDETLVYVEDFLMKKAFHQKYSHFVYVSGQDYPIKSNDSIRAFFSEHLDQSFMSYEALPIKGWGFNGGLDRLDRFWYMKIKNRFFTKVLNRLLRISQIVLRIDRKTSAQMKFFGGSEWKTVCYKHLKYVFEFQNIRNDLQRKIRYSRALDEIWIQSVLLNSAYANDVVNDDLHYMDWETGPDYPKVLDTSDYPKIQQSKALFARKVNSKSSSDLLEFLESHTASEFCESVPKS